MSESTIPLEVKLKAADGNVRGSVRRQLQRSKQTAVGVYTVEAPTGRREGQMERGCQGSYNGLVCVSGMRNGELRKGEEMDNSRVWVRKLEKYRYQC